MAYGISVSQFCESLCMKFRRSSLRVWWLFSRHPLLCGWYGVVDDWCIFKSLRTSLNTLLKNLIPWSVTKLWGNPSKHTIWVTKWWVTVLASWFSIEHAQANFVRPSCNIKIKEFPWWDRGNGLIISRNIFSNALFYCHSNSHWPFWSSWAYLISLANGKPLDKFSDLFSHSFPIILEVEFIKCPSDTLVLPERIFIIFFFCHFITLIYTCTLIVEFLKMYRSMFRTVSHCNPSKLHPSLGQARLVIWYSVRRNFWKKDCEILFDTLVFVNNVI